MTKSYFLAPLLNTKYYIYICVCLYRIYVLRSNNGRDIMQKSGIKLVCTPCSMCAMYIVHRTLFYIYRWIKFPLQMNRKSCKSKWNTENARSNSVVFHEPLPWYKFFIDHLHSLLKMNFHLSAIYSNSFVCSVEWEFKSTDFSVTKVHTHTHTKSHRKRARESNRMMVMMMMMN